MCFVWISKQTAIVYMYNIKWLVFITETESVYCAVRTGSLNQTATVSSLKVKNIVLLCCDTLYYAVTPSIMLWHPLLCCDTLHYAVTPSTLTQSDMISIKLHVEDLYTNKCNNPKFRETWLNIQGVPENMAIFQIHKGRITYKYVS
jgi:hypothetical protein